MRLKFNKRQEKIWRNIGKLFELSKKYTCLINEERVEPRYYTTVFRMQETVDKNILRLTEMLHKSFEPTEKESPND